MATIPSLLEEISESGTTAIEELVSRTRVVYYAGAGLSIMTGDKLVKHNVNVVMAYGM